MWLVALFGCHEPEPDATDSINDAFEDAPGGFRWFRGPDVLSGGPGTPIVPGQAGCGQSVTGPGDVDGDGVPDIVLECGEAVSRAELLVLAGAGVLVGAAEPFAVIGGRAGNAPEALGDVDGDGLGDLGLLGHVGTSDGSPEAWGKIVPGGAARGVVEADDVAWLLEATGGWYAPESAMPAGDLDEDGRADVLISGTPSGSTNGRLVPYLILAIPGASLGNPAGTIDALAVSVASIESDNEPGLAVRARGIGDVDGDGRDDLALILGPGQAGATAALWTGGGEDLGALPQFAGDVSHVLGLGDLDGDGRDEVAVAGDGLAIVPGSALPASGTLDVDPWRIWDRPVRALVACDLDGDGLPELVTTDGIWAGTDLLTPGAPPVGDGLLEPFACLGDLDGDGAAELALGDDRLAHP